MWALLYFTEWKKKIKGRMEKEIEKEVMEKVEGMKKLRFVKGFKKQEYVKKEQYGSSKEDHEDSKCLRNDRRNKSTLRTKIKREQAQRVKELHRWQRDNS